MARYKITTLSPIHISSGEDYENNFNMLYDNGYVYIYDEFKIAQFFIDKNVEIPSNFDTLKQNISKFRKEIISSNIHIRKIESEFSKIDKILFENISTASKPIITGSSLKGSIRTAILDSMTNKTLKWDRITLTFRNKDFDEKRFKSKFDNDLANLFKYLKISDSFNDLNTKIYKTINMKKDIEHQSSRESKVKHLVNLVECIKPNQNFEITIDDISDEIFFKSMGTVCNKFYIPWFKDETTNYFKAPTNASKATFEKLKSLNNNCFLINIGRFAGAERKSINDLRYIKNSKADDKTTTSARTYALERLANDEVYFEKELVPFGWLLCELID